jgi:hypothetical protein
MGDGARELGDGSRTRRNWADHWRGCSLVAARWNWATVRERAGTDGSLSMRKDGEQIACNSKNPFCSKKKKTPRIRLFLTDLESQVVLLRGPLRCTGTPRTLQEGVAR